jgi:hypothetical protein|tara:strand:- start:227 stop:493 length:267 start_codon:yes stop_codon:yes gene_type:complete
MDIQRLNNIKPINHDETKALLLLVMQGHDRKRVQFREGLDGTRHLRIGYWEPLTSKDLEYVQSNSKLRLDEISIFDDDCGRKYWYSIL